MHVYSFITCLMSTSGSGMVFGLRKVTDQEIHSLHPQKLSLGGKTHSEVDNYVFLCSPPQPQCCFLKIRSKRLTPLLKTLPGPPFTWSKIQSPYRVRGLACGGERWVTHSSPSVCSPCLLLRLGLCLFLRISDTLSSLYLGHTSHLPALTLRGAPATPNLSTLS